MSILTQEIRHVQNPALGAALLWRFVCGYTSSQETHEPAPLPVLFVVLPIILHAQTEELVRSTQRASGLRSFVTKFAKSEHSKQDLVYSLHDRMMAFRSLSFESFQIALAGKLLILQNAAVFPTTQTNISSGIANDVKQMMTSAEKLGVWCGSLTLHEAAVILKVRF